MLASRRNVIVVSLGVGGALGGGCIGDDGDEAADDEETVTAADEMFDDIGIDHFELRDPETDDVVAEVHGNHWDGGISTLDPNGTLTVYAEVTKENEERIPIGEEYELVVEPAPDSETAFIDVAVEEDRLTFTGETEGIGELVLILAHDGHADFQSPPLSVHVGDSEGDNDHDDDHDDHDDHDDDH